MGILTCGRCGQQITRNQSSISNWAVIKNEMLCGACQGLTDFPSSIKSYGIGKNGKVAVVMEINVSAAKVLCESGN